MKIVSFVIPCYNSAEYMDKCVESLLPGGEDVEIIIVDDGSVDNTLEIANGYVEKYPTIVKAVHKENGGHGDAVNTGLKNATGLYFKVVDSDDWVDGEAYEKVLETLKRLVAEGNCVDMLLTNYVYEKVYENKQRRMMYSFLFESDKVMTWAGELSLGSSGSKVRQLQEQLNGIANDFPAIPKLNVDGIYGPLTQNSVERFQSIFGLPVTGTVDYRTWYKISQIYVGVTGIAEL